LYEKKRKKVRKEWRSLGAGDDETAAYKRDDNFCYIPDCYFEVSEAPKPLNVDNHPLIVGKFAEVPAKWAKNSSKKTKLDKYY
jgi:hypothetical protein